MREATLVLIKMASSILITCRVIKSDMKPKYRELQVVGMLTSCVIQCDIATVKLKLLLRV